MTNWFSSLIDIEFLDRIKRKKKYPAAHKLRLQKVEMPFPIYTFQFYVVCISNYEMPVRMNSANLHIVAISHVTALVCLLFFRKFNIPGVFDHWNDFNTDLSRSMRSLNVTSVPPTKYFVKQKNGFNVYITVSIIFRRIFFRTKIIEFRHDDYFQCNIFKMLNDLRLYK